jgi:hypothetical protein
MLEGTARSEQAQRISAGGYKISQPVLVYVSLMLGTPISN